MAHTVIVEIDNGKVTVTARGVKGKTCTDITASIEKSLGTTSADSKTGEYYQKSDEKLKVTR